jgi:hypothetical protein
MIVSFINLIIIILDRQMFGKIRLGDKGIEAKTKLEQKSNSPEASNNKSVKPSQSFAPIKTKKIKKASK